MIAARQMSLRGLDAIQRERWDEAEAWFANACETNPTDERAHMQYAELLWRRGLQSESITQLETAVKLSAGDPKLRVRLGEMYLARGDADLAWEQAEQAILSNRHLACAWALQGDIHRQQGNLPQALAAYHRSLSHEGFCPHVQLALADIYRVQSRPERALSTLEALAEHYAPSETPQEVLIARGLALKALGRNRDAVAQLAAALEKGPASADLYFQLAEAQLLAGDATSARLAVSAALAESPQHLPSRELQAHLDRQLPYAAAVRRF